jgi:hypothetical protein
VSDEFRVAALEHCARQLLDKQRHPAGAFDYCRDGFVRERNLGGDLRDHRTHVTCGQPVEIYLHVMRAHRPRRMELGTRRI